MNWDYREIKRIDRTPITRLSQAEIDAVAAKLAADYRAQMARAAEMARIVARAEARRAGIDYDCPWQVYQPTTLELVPRALAA